jgi:hypothetical protein
MPTGEPSSAIVLCSVFAYQDPSHADFKEDSEDAVFIEKRIDNGGWKFTHDIRTGTRKIQNAPKDREETISLEVNQEEEGKNKITLKIYGNSFDFDEEEQCVTENIKGNVNLSVEGDLISTVKGDMKATVEGGLSSTVKGDVKITADGNADVEAGGDISIKSSKSGALSIGNVIATLGAMISELLQALISFKSLGSPAAHTAPDLSATAAQIKAKWDQVFK